MYFLNTKFITRLSGKLISYQKFTKIGGKLPGQRTDEPATPVPCNIRDDDVQRECRNIAATLDREGLLAE